MHRKIVIFIVLLMVHILARADVIGTLDTIEGQHYFIHQFGTPDNPKSYHISINKHYIPIQDIHQLARIDTAKGKIAFLVVLDNGDLAEGRFGLFFYDRVQYTVPSTGEVKTGYVPVLKERNNDGFIFVAYDPAGKAEKIVEISNPNDIAKLVIWGAEHVLAAGL